MGDDDDEEEEEVTPVEAIALAVGGHATPSPRS